MVEEQNNNNEDDKEESDEINTSKETILKDETQDCYNRLNAKTNTSKNGQIIDNTSSLVDDSINNSSTSEDSGIFSSSNLSNDSGLQTPSTSPPRRPIYATKAKEDHVVGDELSKKSPLFDFKYTHEKSKARQTNSVNANERSSSPSSTSSDDSSMLDMVSRAAIYDEIYKLDD